MILKDIPFAATMAQIILTRAGDEFARWLETLAHLINPKAGIEWVAQVGFGADTRTVQQRIADLAAKAGTAPSRIKPAVYATWGASEGIIISVDLVAGAHRDALANMKLFSRMESAWSLARDISITLELLLLDGQEPLLVHVMKGLCVPHRCYEASNLWELVPIRVEVEQESMSFSRGPRELLVPLPSGEHARQAFLEAAVTAFAKLAGSSNVRFDVSHVEEAMV